MFGLYSRIRALENLEIQLQNFWHAGVGLIEPLDPWSCSNILNLLHNDKSKIFKKDAHSEITQILCLLLMEDLACGMFFSLCCKIDLEPLHLYKRIITSIKVVYKKKCNLYFFSFLSDAWSPCFSTLERSIQIGCVIIEWSLMELRGLIHTDVMPAVKAVATVNMDTDAQTATTRDALVAQWGIPRTI